MSIRSRYMRWKHTRTSPALNDYLLAVIYMRFMHGRPDVRHDYMRWSGQA